MPTCVTGDSLLDLIIVSQRYLRQSTRLSYLFFFSSRRRHTRFDCDWSSDVCSSDLSKVGRCGGCESRRRSSFRHWSYARPKGFYVWWARVTQRPSACEQEEHRFIAKIGRASCRERV